LPDQSIITAVEDHIGVLTINRPETLNALDTPTIELLEKKFAELHDDPSVHVIVITGAGERAFVAGGNIADLRSREGLAHYLEFGELIHRVFRRIELSDKPTICAINGWALGGGTEIMLATDIRIAVETAQFGLPEITLGIFPGAGGTQRMIRQISPCKARELMFTGDRITAQQALDFGLINKVVAKGALMEETMAMAKRIAEKSPLTLKLMKRAMIHGADMPMPAALAHEQAMISLVFDTKDSKEGTGAFLEKRKATFTGT
jgi:enoyl-CoA hydratase